MFFSDIIEMNLVLAIGSLSILNLGYSIIRNKKGNILNYKSNYIFVNTLFYLIIVTVFVINAEPHINVIGICY